MQWPNSNYLWNSRLWWSCLQGTMGMWQGRLLSGSGSILGFSGRNLLWCSLPSPSLIVNSFFLSLWLQTQLVSTSQIRSDNCIWCVGVICKTHMYERRRWVGRKRERERNHSLQMCEAQTLLKGNMLGIKWCEICQIWCFLTYAISTFLKRDKNQLGCS